MCVCGEVPGGKSDQPVQPTEICVFPLARAGIRCCLDQHPDWPDRQVDGELQKACVPQVLLEVAATVPVESAVIEMVAIRRRFGWRYDASGQHYDLMSVNKQRNARRG